MWGPWRVLELINLPRLKTITIVIDSIGFWNSGICVYFRIMITVQNISCGRKLKSFLKERKSRESIEYHEVHIAETKVEFYVILTFQIRGQNHTEHHTYKCIYQFTLLFFAWIASKSSKTYTDMLSQIADSILWHSSRNRKDVSTKNKITQEHIISWLHPSPYSASLFFKLWRTK